MDLAKNGAKQKKQGPGMLRSLDLVQFEMALLPKLLLGCGRFCGCVGIFLGETLDAACGVYQFLLAGEERVAIGANFYAQHIALDRGARGKSVPAGAMHGDGVIIGMNSRFHESPFCRGRSAPLPELPGNTAASLGRMQLPIIH